MPTYEYKCAECKATETLNRSIIERDKSVDCWCGSTMRRVFSPPAGIHIV